MKNFNKFISEATAKKCPPGQYYCYTDKKCKKIPKGYRVGVRGYLARDNESDDNDGDSNKNGNVGMVMEMVAVAMAATVMVVAAMAVVTAVEAVMEE